MANLSQTPVYNLKVVLVETGLKPDVLRAWERRYDLPRPHRSPGGHRLYSEYDIETIKWLHARQAEGLSISRAVDLWNEIVNNGSDPLMEYSPTRPVADHPHIPATDMRIESLRNKWLDSVLAFDSLRADEVLDQALAIYPVETVCSDILQQGIASIGMYWYEDKATVQQEHFASAQATRRLDALITATPPPSRQQAVLIGCPPGEWHTFSTLLLNLYLRRRGLGVIYLGANVPIQQFRESAEMIHPDLIILAAQRLTTAATLQSTTLALRDLGIPLAYGGEIFNRLPQVRENIPAHFLGEMLDSAVQRIERLVVPPQSTPVTVNVIDSHWELVRLFREKRSLVEAALHAELIDRELLPDNVDEVSTLFGDELLAALTLGNPAYLEIDLDWVKKLLAGRKIHEDHLSPYLTAYSRALDQVLGEPAAPITDWLSAYLAQSR
jgi:methanogenic corrinoid protein MtbC1